MPIIIPPSYYDVPAIVRTAAHAPSNPALIQRPLALPPHSVRPNGTVEFPGIVLKNPSPSTGSSNSGAPKGSSPADPNSRRN